ncbi:hypothetical protein, partial [Novosphingobium sp. SG919]|uniref:hypothetical protein n=1 Tax=Novosphingobium sp. SG919 TaxID=2587133 RepID=UPI001B7D4E1F
LGLFLPPFLCTCKAGKTRGGGKNTTPPGLGCVFCPRRLCPDRRPQPPYVLILAAGDICDVKAALTLREDGNSWVFSGRRSRKGARRYDKIAATSSQAQHL